MTEKLEPLVPQGINNIVEDNMAALAQLFPSVIKDGQVDFEALKMELQKEPVEFTDPKEVYGLTWTGKRKAIQEAKEDVVNRTLNFVPEESKNPETTKNLYIEGDNKEVLKLLRQNYYGSVKMIYIDPPYNTGKDFVYKDKFAMTKEEIEASNLDQGIVDEEGERLQVNTKEGNNKYHANWLNMMYPRLKLAKELLAVDGVIFISIDDNEQANLNKICDEVFGAQNFRGQITRGTGTPTGQGTESVGKESDFILIYSKSRMFCLDGLPFTADDEKIYNLNDEQGRYLIRPLRKTGGEDRREDRPSMYFSVSSPDGTLLYPVAPSGYDSRWRCGEDKYKELLQNNLIEWKKSDNEWKVYQKFYLEGRKKQVSNLWLKLEGNKKATLEVKQLLDGNYFDFPKPTQLLKQMLQISTESHDIILDFFSGSATTAHAVMQLNAEDGGNRKYICVQIPEETDEKSEAYKAGYKTICEIGKERIRRAGEKIKLEVEEHNQNLKEGENPRKVPDIGFKVFKVADTNIRWNEKETDYNKDTLIEELRNTPELADFVLGAKDLDIVYEMVLRQRNIPLSLPLVPLTNIGQRTYLYGGTLLVCLEETITTQLTEEISSINPLPSKFIFRDSSFGMDIASKRYTFDYFKKQVDKNTDGTEKDYRVEFI